MKIYYHLKFCDERENINFNRNWDSISMNHFINLCCNGCETDIDLIFVKWMNWWLSHCDKDEFRLLELFYQIEFFTMESLLQDEWEKRQHQMFKFKHFELFWSDSHVKVLQQKFHFHRSKLLFVGKLLFMCLYVIVELNWIICWIKVCLCCLLVLIMCKYHA